VVKEMGVNDIVDGGVPRASIPEYMEQGAGLAEASEAWVAGAGHAGDGNVHMSIFQPDKEKCHQLMTDILSAGMDLGGAISAEHGIGLAKLPYMMELEDPIKIALMRGIKAAFDPNGILNPGKVFL
jgi:glycolate oxidase